MELKNLTQHTVSFHVHYVLYKKLLESITVRKILFGKKLKLYYMHT